MWEFILSGTIVVLGTSIFMSVYNYYVSKKDDSLRGTRRILVRLPKICVIISIIFTVAIGIIFFALVPIEADGDIALIVISYVAFFVLDVPLIFLSLYFIRSCVDFDFETKKLMVRYTLKKKKIYSFDNIKEIVETPQGIRIYLQDDKGEEKVEIGAGLPGASLIADKFRQSGFTVTKKETLKK